MDDAIELADMIWQLRSELTRAMLTGEGKDIRFRAEEVELELAVAVAKSKDPNVKVRFWVLEAGGGVGRTHTANQTIKLKLRPVQGDDPDEAALIAGEPQEGEQ